MGFITLKQMLMLTVIAGLSIIAVHNDVRAQEEFVPICETRSAVISGLSSEYKEEPVSMGITAQGTVMEVLSSDNGHWTMIETTSDGMSCLVANGKMWRAVDDTLKTSANSKPLYY